MAAKQCTGQQKADPAAFRAAYGEHPMRNCIQGTSDEVASELKNAAKECKAERQADPAAFRETYGTNENGRTLSASASRRRSAPRSRKTSAEFKNAAKECRAERQADPEAFQQNYGNNHNGRNAFGKCVSSKVKHSEQQPS